MADRRIVSGRYYLDDLTQLRPKHQFRADNVTLSGGNVATIPNMIGSDALVMAAGTLAAPTSDALFTGAQSIVFSGTQRLTSNLPVNSWSFLHDGSGCDIFTIFVSTATGVGVVYATLSDAAPTGHQMYTNSQSTVTRTTNGAGNLLLQGVASGALTGVSTYHEYAYGELASPQILVFNKETVGASGSRAIQPTSASPSGSFTLGAQINGGFPGSFKWAETLIFDRVLSEYERQVVREYIQTRYGITAPVVTSADRPLLAMEPFSWTRADYYNTSGSKVTGWNDKARPGHSLIQNTALNQVNNPVVNPIFNNQVTATFVPASTTRYVSTLSGSSWRFLHNGTGTEVFTIYRATSSTYIWSTTTGPVNPGAALYHNVNQLALFVYSNSSTIISNLSGGTSTLGNATYVDFDSSAPQYTIRSKGTVGFSGTYTNQPINDVNTSLTLGARADAAGPFGGEWAELLVFNRVLKSSERSTVQQYILNRYGIAP